MLWILLVPFASAYTLADYAWPADELPIDVHWACSQNGFTHDEVEAATPSNLMAGNACILQRMLSRRSLCVSMRG